MPATARINLLAVGFGPILVKSWSGVAYPGLLGEISEGRPGVITGVSGSCLQGTTELWRRTCLASERAPM